VNASGQQTETFSLEFQIQPQDHAHLRYAMRILDWPNYDDKGQIMDLDSSVDDLTLIPFLEVLASTQPTNTAEYGLSILNNPDAVTRGSYPWKLYIPMTVDDPAGHPAAFHAKIVFPGGATVKTKARLVWLIQAKDDTQIKEKGIPGYQVIHVYDDPFRITGLKVTRHGGTELALLGTPKKSDEGDLLILLLALSQSFLQGRSDLTLASIEDRFACDAPPCRSHTITDTWGITTTVQITRHTYPHMDAAIGDTIANTVKKLLAKYPTAWRPALLVAYEDKVGFVGLDDRRPAGGGPQVADTRASFDLNEATMMTVRGLKLNQYKNTTQGWVAMNLSEMLAYLSNQYGKDATPDLLRSLKLLWIAWAAGVTQVVKVGVKSVQYANVLTDSEIYKEWRGVAHGAKDVVEYALQPKKFWQEVKGGVSQIFKFIKDHPNWSIALGVTVLTLIVLDAVFKDGRTGEVAKDVNAALGVAFAAQGLYEAKKKTEGFLNLIKGKNPGLTKIGVALAVVGLVVEIALIWYAFSSATANVSGLAYYMALSLAIGMTILAIILFVLSFVGIGLIIGLLLALVDFIGSFFGVSVSGWIAKVLGELVLTVNVITAVDSGSIDFKLKEATWENMARGAVPDNKMTLRAQLQGLIVPENGGTKEDAANSSLQGSLVVTGTSDVYVAADAKNPTQAERPKGVEFSNETNAYLQPLWHGVNLPTQMSVRVNYAILYKKGHVCVGGHCAWWEDASKDSGSTTSNPSPIYLDVLPKTVGELWAWNPVPNHEFNHDPDGDGLTTKAEIALHTDPNVADTDGDGLDDGAEVRLARQGWGTNPLLRDTDHDGLTDREELLLGTRADNPDTDGDGLSDGGERAGYMMDFQGRYPNAWAFPDPLKADADSDGLTDGQEFALKTNPNAGAYELNAWIYATTGFVQPGAIVAISAVGINFTGRQDIKPYVQIRLPPTISPTEFNVSGRVRGDVEYSWSWTPMPVVEPDGWLRWTIWAPVAIAPGAQFTVTAQGRVDANLAHGTVVTFTSNLTYTRSLTETFWAGDLGRVVVDRVRPISTILAPTEGTILRGQAYVVGGTANDPDGRLQKVEVSTNGGTTWNRAEGLEAWNWTWNLPADGNYTLRSQATDQAGWQEDPITSLVHVTVDNTPPATTMRVTHPGGEIASGSTVSLKPTEGAWVITATGQVNDGVSGAPQVAGVGTLSLQRDGRNQEAQMSPPSPGQRVADWQAVMSLPPGRPEGAHQLTTWATDQVGNVQSPITFTWRADNTPPTASELGTSLVITAAGDSGVMQVRADELGRYRPLPDYQPLRGSIDARSGRVSYRALNPADLSDGRLASGDFNNDDIADLAVSAPGYQNNTGAVYLIFGKAGPWLPRHNLSQAEAWLVGPGAGARLGRTLANAGDLNHDGADELIIGGADGAYVIFGQETGWQRGQVLDASSRLVPGRQPLVAGGGDLDGDGFNDAVVAVGDTLYLVPGGSSQPRVGAPLGTLPGAINSLAGAAGAGVMAGSTAAAQAWLWQPISTAAPLPRAPSARITAASGSGTPIAVGYAGDANGDGRPDWLLGDARPGTSTLVGALFLGRDWGGGSYDYLQAATTLFRKEGSVGPGTVVVGLGDHNADGYSDFLLGDGTTAWVMHGRKDVTAWPREFDLAKADAALSHLKSAAGANLNCDASAEAAFLTDDGRVSLFFGGLVGDSCALTPAGVSRVEIGLGAVTDPAAPLTATLPTQWVSAAGVGSAWQALPSVPETVGGGGRAAVWDGRIWLIVGSPAGYSNKSFYAYDPQTNTWTKKADLPYGVHDGAGLVAGGDGYLYAALILLRDAFWRYSPSEDRWEKLADFQSETLPYEGLSLTADGIGHLYLTVGHGGTEFFRYDIATDTWTKKASIPRGVYWGGSLTWAAGAVYALPGWDSPAFFRYDPATDRWTGLANAPGNIGSGGSLAWDSGNFIYALRGQGKSDFYRYNLLAKTWEVLTPTTPASVGPGGALAWLDGYLYVTQGKDTKTFWRIMGTWHVTPQEEGTFRVYARAADAVNNVEADPARLAQFRWRTLPNVPEGVGDGGRLTVVGDRVYVTQGNAKKGFYVFDPATGQWQRLADTPTSVGLGSGLADAGGGNLYLLARDNTFWRYDVGTNTWTGLARYPGSAGEATAVAGDGLGTLYVLNSNQSPAFYRYTPAVGWKRLADTPAAGRWGSALTVARGPGGGVRVYALRGWDSADFWRYDLDVNAWEVLPDIPGSVGSGGALAWDGTDFIYAFRGQASKGFYRYRIAEARWEVLPDAPATVHEGGSLAWGHGGLYALRGKRWDPGTGASYPTPDFWRWDGLVTVDRTPPAITWEPTQTQVTAPLLLLTAHVTDMVAGVENVTFEVDGAPAPAMCHPGAGVWTAIPRVALPSGWTALVNVPEGMAHGGRLATWGGHIWALVGGFSTGFYAYDPASNTWATKASIPQMVWFGGSLVAGGDGYLYATVGAEQESEARALYRYNPAGNAWSRLADAPVGPGVGGGLAADGRGSLYLLQGRSTKKFYRYDIGTNNWASLPDIPQGVGNGGSLAWAAGALYVLPGYVTGEDEARAFYRYAPGPKQWTKLPSVPAYISFGGSLAWDGGRYVYALRGRDTQDFYRYNLTTGAWETLEGTPGSVYTGGALAVLDGFVYATRGWGSLGAGAFWRYGPPPIIRPWAVDRLGNAGYGEARMIRVSLPTFGNVFDNLVAGDLISDRGLVVSGTAMAQAGIAACGFVLQRGNDRVVFQVCPADPGTAYHWSSQGYSLFAYFADGQLSASFWMRNKAGQEWESSPIQITLDTTPPTASFTSPTGGSVITATGRITITGTASDAVSGLARLRLSPDNTASWRRLFLNGSAWQTPWDVPTLDGQTRRLLVEATDRAGWIISNTITITVDNVLPTGISPLTFTPAVGSHNISAGAQLVVTWTTPTDGSGIAGVYAGLDQITNTLPTQRVTGNTFQGTFSQVGTYYFHLLVEDGAGNRLVRHAGLWHVGNGAMGPSQSTVIVDGFLDIPHGEWFPEVQRLGEDDRSGRPQELFIAWDDDDAYLGWLGAHIGVDGDLIWLFNTVPGGTAQFPTGQALPFEADFFFTFRRDRTFGLFRWNGSGWSAVNDPQIQAVNGSSGDVEARIPRRLLEVMGAVQMLALARQPNDGPIWAVLPDTNPLPLVGGGQGGGPWASAYAWSGWTPDVIPNAGQPDAGLTWLHLSSVQPSGLYLPVGGTITYNLVAGNAATRPADQARLTLTGEGVVFETFSGPGTCTNCPPGSGAWTVDLGTIPARDQVAITVTTRTLPTGGATVPVTTTARLTAVLPDAEPGDNMRSMTHLVDGTPPAVTFVAPVDGSTIQSGRQEVVGEGNAGRGAPVALVEFSTDGATWQPAAGDAVWVAQVDVPAEGTLTVYARATDEAGNVGPATTATFIADGVAPTSTITPPAGVIGGKRYLLTGTAHDPNPQGGKLETVEVQVDDGPWMPMDSLLRLDGGYTWRFDWSLPEGQEGITHTIRARATDTAGNIEAPGPSIQVQVDTVGPRTIIAYPPDGTWLEPGTTQVVVWGWSEDGSGVTGVQVSLDGGVTWVSALLADEARALLQAHNLNVPTSERANVRTLWAFAGTLPEGEREYLIQARGVDKAGNVERVGPAVVVYMAVSRLWLPLMLKAWQAPVVPTPPPTAPALMPSVIRLWLPLVMKGAEVPATPTPMP
jgi:N-acetylneuraminic acid mutarotase